MHTAYMSSPMQIGNSARTFNGIMPSSTGTAPTSLTPYQQQEQNQAHLRSIRTAATNSSSNKKKSIKRQLSKPKAFRKNKVGQPTEHVLCCMSFASSVNAGRVILSWRCVFAYTQTTIRVYVHVGTFRLKRCHESAGRAQSMDGRGRPATPRREHACMHVSHNLGVATILSTC